MLKGRLSRNDTIKPSILFGEEVVNEAVEEEVVVLRSHDLEHHGTCIGFGPKIAVHEVLHAAVSRQQRLYSLRPQISTPALTSDSLQENCLEA